MKIKNAKVQHFHLQTPVLPYAGKRQKPSLVKTQRCCRHIYSCTNGEIGYLMGKKILWERKKLGFGIFPTHTMFLQGW